MASLSGVSVASSYTSLLKLNGNTDTLIDGDGTNAIQVVDGDGSASPLFLNRDRLGIGGQPSSQLHITQSGTTTADGIRLTNGESFELMAGIIGSTSAGFSIFDVTDNAVRLSIDTSGNIAFGGLTPTSYYTDYDNLVLGATSGSTGVTIVSGGSNNGTVAFADGTSSNARYRGEVGFSHNNEFLFLNTAGSYRMVIDTSGNVGIGVTDPNSTFMVGGSTSSGGDISLANTGTNLTSSSTLGSILFKGKDSGGSSYGIGAKIVAKCTETWNEATSEGTKLEFYTTANGASTNGDPVMVIGQDGASTFAGKVEVNGYGLTLVRSAPVIEFNDTDESGTGDGGGKFKISSDNDRLGFFGRSDNDGTWNERVYLTRAGTLNLDEKLTFSGTTTQATASINLNSNNYLYVTGGTSGLSLTAEGGADKIQIEDGGGSGRILFECTSTQVAKFDTNSRISLSNNTGGGADNTVFGKLAGNALTTNGDENVLIGHEAGNDMTTGHRNVVIGYQAGDKLTSGDRSVAIGYGALGTEDTGNRSIAIGFNALSLQNSSTATTGNMAIGVEAGFYNETGIHNTHIGYNSGLGTSGQSGSNITAVGYESLKLAYGQGNTALGQKSGVALTSGVRNVLIGVDAGASATSSSNMVLIGTFAGDAIDSTNADGTVAIGRDALTDLTSGSANVAIGFEAGTNATTASLNTFVGHLAGHGNDSTPFTGSWNTCIGEEAGYLLEGASNGNTLVGQGAGDTITTGDENTCVGRVADVSGSTAVNQTVIGYGALGQGDNTVSLGNSSVTDFYLAPGNTSGQTIRFNDAGTGGFIQYDHSDDQLKLAVANTINVRIFDGSLQPGTDNTQDLGASSRAWKDVYYEGSITDTSDERYKKNIEECDLGLEFINELKPSKYKKKDDDEKHPTRYGIIAQQVIDVLNKKGNKNDFAGIDASDESHLRADYIQFIAPLIKAVQELSAKVAELENK